MKPTRRGFALLALPSVLFAFGVAPVIIFGAYALAFSLLLIDCLLTPIRSSVGVSRQLPHALAIGHSHSYTLIVENLSQRTLTLELREGVPKALQPDAWSFALWVAPGEAEVMTITLFPTRRGRYPFQDCWIGMRSRLGLSSRWRGFPIEDAPKVLPNVIALRAYDLMAKRGLTRALGIRPRLENGEGTEIAHLREYQPGDDYRRIDWKATARAQAPVSREFQAERRRDLVFVIDCGRRMGTEVNGMLMLDHIINASLLCAHVADREGDRPGILLFSDRVHTWLPPATGKRQQARILEALTTATLHPVEPVFSTPLRFLAKSLRRRTLCMLFSDFGDPLIAQTLSANLPALAQQHLSLCVHLENPALKTIADTAPSSTRSAVQAALAHQSISERKTLLRTLRQKGAHVLESPAHQFDAQIVNRYLQLRAESL